MFSSRGRSDLRQGFFISWRDLREIARGLADAPDMRHNNTNGDGSSVALESSNP
jgi:hypothetical protein